jgi:galactokinase
MTGTIRRAFEAAFGRPPEVVARAPGRIEFVGNHTDYNGGPVLGVAIDRSVWVALAPRDDGLRRFASDASHGSRTMEIPSGSIVKQSGHASWINYPLAILSVMPSFGFTVPDGFDYLAMSDLPSGAGLSSSAAIELASALCFLAVTRQDCAPDVLARLGRKAENDFVGVPCGILDQGVSAFGRVDHLVHIDCRELKFSHVAMPPGVSFWIFNTHTKHALVDGLYAARHRECMEAAAALGVALLADATLAQLDAAAGIPPVVAMRARHVLGEIARVDETVAALAAGRMTRVGELLTASHRSSQYLFENSTPELDFLVNALAGSQGVHGARLTGGGFGGAVLAVTGPGFGEGDAASVGAKYELRFGTRPELLHLLSCDGARLFVDAAR